MFGIGYSLGLVLSNVGNSAVFPPAPPAPVFSVAPAISPISGIAEDDSAPVFLILPSIGVP